MYLLDTNILSEIIRKRPNQYIISQLRSKSSHELFTSTVCVMELRFGSRLRENFKDFWRKLEKRVISKVNVIPISEKEAIIAGDILAEMKKSGQIIGVEDALIAASALVNQCTMVTGTVRHFSRIKGLVVENWLEAV